MLLFQVGYISSYYFSEQLAKAQSPAERPIIVARVFAGKLKELEDDLYKKHVLGRVVAHVRVTEFQKRGLPHVHILLMLHKVGNWIVGSK